MRRIALLLALLIVPSMSSALSGSFSIAGYGGAMVLYSPDTMGTLGIDQHSTTGNMRWGLRTNYFLPMSDYIGMVSFELVDAESQDPFSAKSQTAMDPTMFVFDGSLGYGNPYDYGFFRFRTGLSKMPISIYNDTRNVGFDYPWVFMPTMYQSTVGIPQNIRGFTLEYEYELFSDATLFAVGQYGTTWLQTGLNEEGQFDIAEVLEAGIASYKLRNALAARLHLKIEKSDWELLLGAGGFHGSQYVESGILQGEKKRVSWQTVIGFLQFKLGDMTLQGEWVQQNQSRGTLSYYGMVMYEVLDGFALHYTFDQFYADQDDHEYAYARSHGYGVTYKPLSWIVVKAERRDYESNLLIDFMDVFAGVHGRKAEMYDLSVEFFFNDNTF